MKNKDTNTDYSKVVKGPKVTNSRNYNWYLFFAWDLYYFLFREFSSSTLKKSPPPKVLIPNQNPNLT